MNLDSQRLKQVVLAALADKDMVKILDCAMFRDKSVNDIIKECDIPHTSAYRKIKYLLDQGLLICTRMEFTEDGKKFSLFKYIDLPHLIAVVDHHDSGSPDPPSNESEAQTNIE